MPDDRRDSYLEATHRSLWQFRGGICRDQARGKLGQLEGYSSGMYGSPSTVYQRLNCPSTLCVVDRGGNDIIPRNPA